MSLKRERIEATLAGERVDQIPITMWRHFYGKEVTAEGLAESMLGFQREYDWDFMKVNPRAQYHVEDWGATFEYTSDPNTAPNLIHAPIASANDWETLTVLDPTKGTLGEHLHALSLIKNGLNGQVPFVMTVFNPLSIAGRLVSSDEILVQHLREHPKKVHAALEVITESYRHFVTECLNVGVDGIFYAATAWASYDLLTDAEYEEFGRPYDLRLLDASNGAPFDILHVCRSNNMLSTLANYPVQALNWDDRDDTNCNLENSPTHSNKVLIGGIDRRTMTRSKPVQSAVAEAQQAVDQMASKAFILGPTCSISPYTPDETLRAVTSTIRK